METANSSTKLTMSDPAELTTRVGDTFRAAIVAGLVAGVIVSLFHLLFTERLIDLAIAYEEALGQGSPHETMVESVPRDIQKGVGLVSGFLAYGLFLSFIYAVAFMLSQRLLPTSGAKSKAIVLAVMAYWHLALFPFLKYPANPPAVGDPDTIAQRQGLFMAAMAVAFVGTVLAYSLNSFLQRNFRMTSRTTAALTLGFYAAYSIIAFFLLPSDEPTLSIPFELVLNFRMLSILGLTMFWAILGITFSLLAGRWKESLSSVLLSDR